MNSYEKPFYISLLIIFLIFALYGAALLWIVWPISEFSVTKAGTFGDSFGAVIPHLILLFSVLDGDRP
ncbi:hypothetical protein, partial [Aeromonas caviae]|uniref:hypothetical protein n=1 Tax=Aeromonas caviae TaxID=648 RepID=UPI002B470211